MPRSDQPSVKHVLPPASSCCGRDKATLDRSPAGWRWWKIVRGARCPLENHEARRDRGGAPDVVYNAPRQIRQPMYPLKWNDRWLVQGLTDATEAGGLGVLADDGRDLDVRPVANLHGLDPTRTRAD